MMRKNLRKKLVRLAMPKAPGILSAPLTRFLVATFFALLFIAQPTVVQANHNPNAPRVMAAETNLAGDAVILTFDKDVTITGTVAGDFSICFNDGSRGCAGGGKRVRPRTAVLSDNNKITLGSLTYTLLGSRIRPADGKRVRPTVQLAYGKSTSGSITELSDSTNVFDDILEATVSGNPQHRNVLVPVTNRVGLFPPVILTQAQATNTALVTITGTAKLDFTVTLSVSTESGTVVNLGEATVTGTTWAKSVRLMEGANVFTATASDGPGNTATSTAVTITLDTDAPSVPVITAPTDNTFTNTVSVVLSGTTDADSTVELFQGGTSTGMATVTGTIWTIGVTLTTGLNTFTATATDAAGNTSDATDVVTITLDTDAPSVPVITAPTDNTFTNTVSVVLSGTTDADSTVELFQGGTSTGMATVTGTIWTIGVTLTTGLNTFTATATDAAGNTSDATDVVTITLDTDAPSVPVITAPTDNTFTNTVSVVLSGTTDADSTVELFQGGTSTGMATVTGTIWTIGVTLTTGLNTFTATATDAAGNTSDATDVVTITLDTDAPSVPVITAPTDNTFTNTVSVVLSGTTDADSTVELFQGGTSTGMATVTGTIWTIGVTLTTGLNTFTATATDAAGNTSDATDVVTITLDTDAPSVPVITAPTDNTFTNTVSVVLSGTTDADSTVELFQGGTSTGMATVTGTIWTIGVTLTTGLNTFTATATDAAGNTSDATDVVTITLDTDAPSVPVITAPADNTFTNTVSVVLSGTTDADSTVELFQGGTSTGMATVTGTLWTIGVTLTTGLNTFTATATDAAGNTSDATDVVTITLDTDAPSVPVITAPTDNTFTNTVSVVLSGTTDADSTVELFQGGTSTGMATVTGTIWTIGVTLTTGLNTFTATATDAAGNTSDATDVVTITLDTDAPSVPVITAPADNTFTNTVSVVLSGTTDADSTVELFQGGTSTGMATVTGTIWTIGVTLTTGLNTFTATATDAAGNTSDATDVVTITLDTDAPSVPVITAPADNTFTNTVSVVLSGTTDADSTVELFQGGTSTGMATVTGTIWTIGVTLTTGLNTFTATATDRAGNTATSAVTITLDTATPTVTIASGSRASGDTVDADTLSYTVTFSEAVTGFEKSDITVTGTANGGNPVASNLQGAGAVYTFDVVKGSSDGSVTVSIAADVAKDDAGNYNTASAPYTLTIDTGLNQANAKQLNEKILPNLIQSMLGSTMAAVNGRVDATFSGSPQVASYQLDGQTVQLDSQTSLSANLQNSVERKLPTYIKSLQDGTLDWKHQLGNSSFVMPLNALDDDGGGAGATVWGSGDYSNLSDEGWSGNVFGFQLGVDQLVRKDLLAGGLVSWSKGDVDYTLGGERGKYTHRITSVHPYLARSYDGVNLWGSVGYGQGKLSITQQGDAERHSGTRLLSLAAGVSGRLMQYGQSGLNLKSDLSLARTNIDGSADKRIPADKLSSQRLRLLLEVEQERQLASGGRFNPLVEVGLRYDGGVGDSSGVGAVLGFGGRYVNTTGLIVEGKLHTLLGRKDYKEWGIQGVIRQQSGANEHGLSFSLSPSYGATGNSANQVWQQELPDGNSNRDNRARLDVNMGYGLFTAGGLLTPYSEMRMGDSNHYRLGLRWKPNSPFNLHLYGERKTSNDSGRVLLESRIRF